MKVFISWSGTTSRAVAEALSDWLPKVLQGIEPFVSAKDIDKGANWTVELARELEDAEFGIICLAPDNLLSPWLNYETGAITKSVNSRVCPVLFKVAKQEVKPPMAQLQLTDIEEDEFVLLMESMNKASGSPLRHDALKEAVAVWWPRLASVIGEIAVPESSAVPSGSKPAEPAKPQVDVNEMVEEVLHLTRSLDRRLRSVERGTSSGRGPVGGSSRVDGPLGASRLNSSVKMAVAKLIELAASYSIVLEPGHVGGRVIDLFAPDLPTDLPEEIAHQAIRYSTKYGLRIRIIGGRESFVFDETRSSDSELGVTVLDSMKAGSGA